MKGYVVVSGGNFLLRDFDFIVEPLVRNVLRMGMSKIMYLTMQETTR